MLGFVDGEETLEGRVREEIKKWKNKKRGYSDGALSTRAALIRVAFINLCLSCQPRLKGTCGAICTLNGSHWCVLCTGYGRGWV